MGLDAVRFTPEHHLVVRCRCGEPVSLPAFACATHTCRCGRRYAYDCDLLTVARPDGERET